MVTFHLGLSLGIACLFLFSVSALSDELGFSLDLIHRDSPKSPFYNASETRFERVKNAVMRSHNRLNGADINVAPPTKSKVINNGGNYLMEIGLGTPSRTFRAIVATSNDITWVQCAPCKNCYKQKDPVFNPGRTKTYKSVGCSEGLCQSVTGAQCSRKDTSKACEYEVQYGDGSHTAGTLSKEKLTLASAVPKRPPVEFPSFVFGCGHDNAGRFDPLGSGQVGLGKGSGSLVSQLGPSIGYKFSHCLIPLTSENAFSDINFGSSAVVSGRGTVTVPLIRDSGGEGFYLVSVNGIRTAKKLISGKYKAIIDSGTAVTILPLGVYNQLESTMIGAVKLQRTNDPNGVFKLCYKTTKAQPGIDFPAPPITVDFGGGAFVEWSTLNTFLRVSDDAVCFAFIGDPSGNPPVIGSLAQMNFLVGYDLQKQTVSFKRVDCAKTGR